MSIGWRILNAASLIAVVVMNYLANALPLFGRTTEEISAKYPVLVTPASYAFSIWALIYLLLALFVIASWFPSQLDNKVLRSIGPWFMLSCLFNIGWLLLWHRWSMLRPLSPSRGCSVA